MAKGIRKRENFRVYAEILQNGVVMASVDKPLNRRSSISITNNYRGDLALPLYPLSKEIEFLKIRRRTAIFHSDQPWDGLITSQGSQCYLSAGNRRQQDVELHPGDYGSLTLGDLTLLLKVSKVSRREGRVSFDSSYRAGLFSLLFPKKIDRQVFLASLFLAMLLFGGFLGGLLVREDDRPGRFEDLEESYILPFVAPGHLRAAPEALQFNLDRSRLIHSVVDYYRAYTEMLLGLPIRNSRYLPRTTRERYEMLFQQQEQKIQQVKTQRSDFDSRVYQENGAALLGFYAAVGETYQGKLLRLMDKIEIGHYTMSQNLSSRRLITEELQKDQPYDYVNYKEQKKFDEKVLKQLASIRPWQTLTDEGLMYAEAQRSARNAEDKRAAQAKESDGATVHMEAGSARPIFVDPAFDYTTFTSEFESADFDRKIRGLQGRSPGTKKIVVEKEPLIGEIEPSLVKQFIKKQGFELRLCYELALRKNAGLKGMMNWRWIIDSRGSASEVLLVSSEIRDSDLTRCVANKIGTWKFPRPRRGSIEVTHRFTFVPHRL